MTEFNLSDEFDIIEDMYSCDNDFSRGDVLESVEDRVKEFIKILKNNTDCESIINKLAGDKLI